MFQPKPSIEWTEPEVNRYTGKWHVGVDHLRQKSERMLERHELAVQVSVSAGSANVMLSPALVERFGVMRCWWWLREDVVEWGALLSLQMENAMAAALEMPWPLDDDDDHNDWGWSRLDYVG